MTSGPGRPAATATGTMPFSFRITFPRPVDHLERHFPDNIAAGRVAEVKGRLLGLRIRLQQGLPQVVNDAEALQIAIVVDWQNARFDHDIQLDQRLVPLLQNRLRGVIASQVEVPNPAVVHDIVELDSERTVIGSWAGDLVSEKEDTAQAQVGLKVANRAEPIDGLPERQWGGLMNGDFRREPVLSPTS